MAKLENTMTLFAETAVRKEKRYRWQKNPFRTFPEVDYLGFADIPAGTNLKLTFEETVRSKRTYLRKAEAVL